MAVKFINRSIRNKIIFWMLISLTISSITILLTTSQKIKDDHTYFTKQQLQFFSNNIFNELRVKMNENDIEGLHNVIQKAKTIENVSDVSIIKSEKLIEFQKSKENFTKEKDILNVFYSKVAFIKEDTIDNKSYVTLITPMIATNECLTCHKNQNIGDVVAIMKAVFLIDSYNQHAKDIIWNIIYNSLFFGILTIIILLIIIKRATEPINGLKYGFQRLLDSNEYGSSVKLKIRTEDEIGDVASLFNQYIDKLSIEFKASTERFAQSIMDTQSDLVVTLDEERNITNVNKAFLDFFEVENLDEFRLQYNEHLAYTFKKTDSKDFISEYIDGVLWEIYIRNNKNKIHKVILQNKKRESTFTVSTNSIVFDGKVFATSVFTNIDELEIIRKEIESGHKRFKILFDNANEGFLYFNKDMVIGSEYSLQAKEIFGFKIERRHITDLLFQDEEERAFIKDTLVGILDETKERQEILISLLKDEFLINGKFIKVQYKVIGKDVFMLILTDITQNKYLNEQIKDEQQVYKMVITVMTFFEQFTEVSNQYQEFITEIERFKSIEMLPDLRREIHTYKGLFAQLELLNIVKKLHSLENAIDYCLKIKELDDDIVYLSSKLLYGWFEVDLNVINKILKHNIFMKQNTLKIEKKRIENIYNNIEKYENMKMLKHDIEQLTYHNIKDSFYGYGQLIVTLAQRFEKPMHELVLDCEDIYLSNIYKPFLNTLVHVFRNSLDHGIEIAEERILVGKDPKGTISCDVRIVNHNLEIHYSDDGRGIDTNKVKSKILEKKLLTKEKLDTLDEEEILMLIFIDSLSTKEIVTDISGRGVGLASLKEEVDKLQGSIKVINHPAKGVEFLFVLPMID